MIVARLLITSPVKPGANPLSEGDSVQVPAEMSQDVADEIVALGCGRLEESAATDAQPKKKGPAQRKTDHAAE